MKEEETVTIILRKDLKCALLSLSWELYSLLLPSKGEDEDICQMCGRVPCINNSLCSSASSDHSCVAPAHEATVVPR